MLNETAAWAVITAASATASFALANEILAVIDGLFAGMRALPFVTVAPMAP